MAVKDELLVILEKNRGSYVSGQSVADTLGVSRNAVWKAVDRLKSEGYPVASGGGGYMLASDCDRLIKKRLEMLLPPEEYEIDLFLFDSIDSTSNECKRRLLSQERSFAVLAESQTAGRGRNGKNFYSPDGQGLYFSIALKRKIPMEAAGFVTTYAAVCVLEEIKKLTGLACQIKWVNDIFYKGRKICGILSEAVSDVEGGMISDVIIGIGIDLHPVQLPEELTQIAGSLDCGPVKNELAAAVIKRLLAFDPKDRSHMETYRSCSAVIGKNIRYSENGEIKTGFAEAIDDTGGLIIHTNGLRRTLHSGEISVIL